MAVCKICGKGTMAGRNIRHKHSGLWERKAPATPRVFEVNIHKKTLTLNGDKVKIGVCSKCLKRIKKDSIFHGYRLPQYLPQKEKE